MSTKILHAITPQELRRILALRGEAMTGFAFHRVPFNGAYRKGYYWPFGGQPDERLKEALSARCPLKAAEKFLKYFERCSGTHAEGRGYAEPKPLPTTPAWMHQATYA